MGTTHKQEMQYARSLIEASLDPFVTIAANGKITDVNEALIKVTGVDRELLIGTDFSDYFTEPAKAREGYRIAFDKGFVADYPLTIHHKNGNLTDVLYNASVYKDDKGNVLGVFAAARDVTEQKWAIDLRIANKELLFQNDEKEKRAAELAIANKELAFQNDEKEKRAAELLIANNELRVQNAEREKLKIATKELAAFNYSVKLDSQYSRSLIEASRDPLFTISPKGKITDMNEATVRVTGLTREQLIDTDFFNYFTEPEKARQGYQQVFIKGFVADYPLTIKDSELTPVLFNGSVYKDDSGNVVGAVVVARDITDQKKIEKELTEAKVFAELATAIAEETQAQAETATGIARDAVKAKQQFLSNMSHEIRTPMNAIIGFTKVVLKTDLTPKQREYLNAIKMSGDALIVLINDILDLAKVDAGKMTFEQTPFKMALSISAMLHLFETKIQEKNLVLVKEYDKNIPEVLVGDPVRLHQIILNLVSNAVKFTAHGKITVSVLLQSQDDENVVIKFSVTDTGIGIPDNKIETIFENFQQASSSTSRLFGGTGLGLAIVKKLVESQDGEISVKSKPDIGSTFSFTLTFQKTKANPQQETHAVELNTEIKNMRILVVEDIPLNQLLMKTILDELECICDIANNGKLAIEKLETNEYDIILMDLQMPEMNGFEATTYIRNILESKIPIIALTADVTTVDLAKCKAVGMDDYIAKPIDETLLLSKLEFYMKNSPHAKAANASHGANIISPRYTSIDYLERRFKSNKVLIAKMISLYVEQTPGLVETIKVSLEAKDWNNLYEAAHKMIPSFSMMGINVEYENMAREIQNLALINKDTEELRNLVTALYDVCMQACVELEEEREKLVNAG